MTFYNKQGNCNMTNSVDIVANSISLILPDGTLQSLTIGGSIAPVNNPTFTGNVGGVTKDQIGLGNVDNTSDLNKPLSIATQSALYTVIANTNTTLTSHLGLINTNTAGLSTLNTKVNTNEAVVVALNSKVDSNTLKINGLNTSVSNINLTLTSQLNLINNTNANLTSLTSATNSTFASQLATLNSHTNSISSLNTSVSNINLTLTSQLNLINTTNTNLSLLTTSTNNTFASQLVLINNNSNSISTLNSNINNLTSSTNSNYNTLLGTVNSHTTSISTLNTSVSNINSTLATQLPTLATQAYVNTAVANLIGAAPASLDTLYELASAISNNSNFSVTILNSIANVGVTATTALRTTNSILDIIPTLATVGYVGNYYQPLDTTGTLVSLPNNITTSDNYFPGFPKDQPLFTSTGGATATNQTSSTDGKYQLLNFPIVGSSLTFTSSNTHPLASCQFSVVIKMGTASGFTLSVTNGGITYVSTLFDQNLSTTQNTIFTLPFTAPAASVTSLNFNIIGRAGSIYAWNWSAYDGSSVDTRIRGNLVMTSGTITSYDFLYGASKTSLTNTLSTLATAASVSAVTKTSLGLGNVANTSPSALPISTATQAALSTLTTSVTNAGATATTALNATNSILNTITNLATYAYVDDNMQPLDATGTLEALPNNIATSNTYFPGFPADQIAWTKIGGATSTNFLSTDIGRYQLLNFPSTGSSLTLTCSNNCPSQTCTFSVNIRLGTATSFILSVTYGGVTYGSGTYTQNLSTTQYSNISLSFAAPGVSVSALNFNITNATGTLYTRGWAAFAGSSVDTLVRGNLNIPYGNVSSSDFLYGANNTSLINTLSTLATAASVSAITPTSLGLGNVTNTADTAKTFTQSQITGLDTKLGTLQPKLINLNNINNVFNSADALMLNFTPKDQPVWNVVGAGTSVVNNDETITNAWGYVENTAQKLTFNGSSIDMFITIPTSGYTGQTLVVKAWVKLGTATNFALCVNNTQTWNTVGGQSFTGLSASTYKQISFTFACPSTLNFAIHIGGHSQSGVSSQSGGTVFTYGWQIFVKGKQSLLESNLVINGTLSASDVLYDGITSLTTKIGTLAPYTSSNSFTANTLTAYTGITGSDLQINGNAKITGDVLYGLLQTSLTSTINGKANLSGATFTGQITQQVPVSISFYGSPTMYSSAGVLQTSGFTTQQASFHLLFSTYTNRNWTPTYTSTYKLAVPFTGLYSLQFTFSSGTACSCFQFITKNMGNGNEVSTWLDKVIASSSPTIAASLTNSISGTAYLTTSDYICFSIFTLSGSFTYYDRTCATITLIQRTA